MRKKVSILLLALLLLPLVSYAQDIPPRPTTAGFVFDYQNVIDDEIEADINEIAKQLQVEGKMELFVVTVPTIGDLEPYEYGLKFFREWGIGDTEKDNGLLIYATTDMGEGNNKVRIATGYGLEGVYTDSKTGELIDTYMLDALVEGDYTTAFAKVTEAVRQIEAVDYTWQSAQVDLSDVQEELTIGDWVMISGLLLGVLALVGFIGYDIFRSIQKAFYNVFESMFKKDIRSKRYLKYVEKQKIRDEKRRLAAGSIGITSDNSSDSGSSDSYSGGSGDSGGGGSDRSF